MAASRECSSFLLCLPRSCTELKAWQHTFRHKHHPGRPEEHHSFRGLYPIIRYPNMTRSGARGGKKNNKITRRFLDVHFGHFLADLCCFFGACQKPKHCNLQCFCGRQMTCYKGLQMNSIHRESRTPPATLGDNYLETLGELDTTSETGRQWAALLKGRHMNWRHPESRTPQARLGNKWIAIRGEKWIGDIGRAGHHQPDWETNG